MARKHTSQHPIELLAHGLTQGSRRPQRTHMPSVIIPSAGLCRMNGRHPSLREDLQKRLTERIPSRDVRVQVPPPAPSKESQIPKPNAPKPQLPTEASDPPRGYDPGKHGKETEGDPSRGVGR